MNKFDLKSFKHKTELSVRFMDVDALQHVNNARYLNFLEESRIAYSQEVLNTFNDLNELNVVVARIEIDFLRPITFGEGIEVYTKVSKVGNKSFVFESVICAHSKGKSFPAAHAFQTLVAFDPKSRQSITLPKEIKDKVEAFEATK